MSVKHWGRDFSLFPTLIAQTLATASDAVYGIIQMVRTRKNLDRFPLPSEAAWLTFYKHPTYLQQHLLPLLLGNKTERHMQRYAASVRHLQRGIYHFNHVTRDVDDVDWESPFVRHRVSRILQMMRLLTRAYSTSLEADNKPDQAENAQ